MAAPQAAPPGFQVTSRPFIVLGDPSPDVLPASLHPTTFQPIDGLQAIIPSGMTRDLYAANLRAQGLSPSTVADWQVADGTRLLRRIRPRDRNQWNALCGQAIGRFPDDPNKACDRCRSRGDTRTFSSCRVVAYLTTAEHYRVVAKGSCMNCLFSGQAQSCSLRLHNNDWAQEVLHAIDPSFSYPNFDTVKDPEFTISESVVDLAEIQEEEEDVKKTGRVRPISSRRRPCIATKGSASQTGRVRAISSRPRTSVATSGSASQTSRVRPISSYPRPSVATSGSASQTGRVRPISSRPRPSVATSGSASRVKAQQRACRTTPTTASTTAAATAAASHSPNQLDSFSTGQTAPLEIARTSPGPGPATVSREASPLVLRGRTSTNTSPLEPTPELRDSVRGRSHLLSAHPNLQYDITAVGELSRYLPSDPKCRFRSPLSPALRRSIQPQTFAYALSILRGRMDEIRQDYRHAARDHRAIRQLYDASRETSAGDQFPCPDEWTLVVEDCEAEDAVTGFEPEDLEMEDV